MTANAEIFAALMAPFGGEEVKSRTQAGRQLSYITARTVMNRLDDVLGPENWWDEYLPSEHGALCKLTVRLPDGTVVTKADAGGCAGMADPGDDDKSGFSDAFKRAAVKFGVGRYLYRDGVPSFARSMQGQGRTDRPAGRREPRQEAPGTPERRGNDLGIPQSGKALFAWARKHDDDRDYGVIKHLNRFGKQRQFPFRMVEWSQEQVSIGHREACSYMAGCEAEWARTIDATDARGLVTQADADMTDEQWEGGRE